MANREESIASAAQPEANGSAGLRRLPFGIWPAVAAAIFFEIFLGHRHDYTGHFLAGYGGTWMAAMVVMRATEPSRYATRSVFWSVPLCLGCIGIGTFTEATAFRLAKFDEIDFCCQSLGAVLSSIASLKFSVEPKPPLAEFDRNMITGIVLLGIGGLFAVA